jgi:hypothetical protein
MKWWRPQSDCVGAQSNYSDRPSFRLEVAEHILQQAAAGERDLNRLKISAFEKLGAAA